MMDNRKCVAGERNAQRAACAKVAVAAYAGVKQNNNTDFWDFESENEQDRLADLLTDLRHWSDLEGLDFEKADKIADSHYKSEIDEEVRERFDQAGAS